MLFDETTYLAFDKRLRERLKNNEEITFVVN